MNLPALQQIDCTNKRVLIRVDFNVDAEALDNPIKSLRLTVVKESIDYILSHTGATVTLITHFGRPDGKRDEKYSIRPLIAGLEKIFERSISYTKDCLAADDFQTTNIALRENLRFYAEEEANDEAFAEKLASGFDLYVNEAFSVCHRKHASVVAVTKFLPSVAGIHLQKEIHELEQALRNPARPAVAILGGAKIETKLPLIKVLENLYDFVLVGGVIANEAIDQNIPLAENVLLPIDFRGEGRLDIGDETIKKFTEILDTAKTILWNGPLGKFEEPPYDTGTHKITEVLARSSAYVIAGGGESLSAIQKAGAITSIDVLSTGGGAMLDFLAGETLPGLEALA